ncbi:hypothetical protein [Streptomyces sp. NPDC002215]|uniref:hypothetical protein n=1 Tax=Streptomyces sp. NPDC002215 TaxID=3154412 RepID=UPI00332238F1
MISRTSTASCLSTSGVPQAHTSSACGPRCGWVFHRHPWIDRLLAGNDLEDEDVFSLAVARAEAYGWSSTHLGRGPLDGCRWGHNDPGEYWTEDNRVRQLAWLQVAVEEKLRVQHLPLLPVATVLSDVLHHVGTYTLTGLPPRAPPPQYAMPAWQNWCS